jgi:hypothetical protein
LHSLKDYSEEKSVDLLTDFEIKIRFWDLKLFLWDFGVVCGGDVEYLLTSLVLNYRRMRLGVRNQP